MPTKRNHKHKFNIAYHHANFTIFNCMCRCGEVQSDAPDTSVKFTKNLTNPKPTKKRGRK